MRPSARGGVLLLLWSQVVTAQEVTLESASQATSNEANGTDANTSEDHRAVLARKLNPADYGPAFNSGAQTEIFGPVAAVSSLLVGYDAVFMQVEVGLGFGIGGNPFEDAPRSDTYVLGLRLALPIHRGIAADYSLVVGGGSTFVNPSEGGTDTIGAIGLGARFRAFFSPSIAVFGSLGLAAFFAGRDDASVFLGARPLGSAAVVYFFR